MKIIRLEAENFKRLHAVAITPEGSAVVIGGKNGAGKSSVLDAIQSLLGGLKKSPAQPVRRGAKQSRIEGELDTGVVITRTATKKSDQLKVTAADGSSFSSPQAMLDKLVGDLSFDPLAFGRMDPRKQAEVVRKVAGLDFTEMDAERARLYEQRTSCTRTYKAHKVAIAGMDPCEDAPDEEVDVAGLMEELSAARKANGEVFTFRQNLENSTHATKEQEHLVEMAKRALDEAKSQLERRREARDHWRQKVSAAEEVDEEPIEKAIAGASEVNRRVRSKAEYVKAKTEFAAIESEGKKMSRAIEAIDEKKAAAIEAADYPIEGLTVTDDGVELDGLPWEQASSARQLQCSVAMGLSLNPELRVLLIRDGSLLDDDSLKAVSEMATKADAQVWIERVSAGEECTIVIEDGSIAEVPQ